MAIDITISGIDKLNRASAKIAGIKAQLLAQIEVASNQFANDALGTMKRDYLSGPRPGRLGVGNEALRSKTGFKILKSAGGLKVRFGSNLPYAAIHEYGGTVHPRITEKMRGWAWHRFRETGDAKFRGLALTRKNVLNIKIPARPYLAPGIKDNLPKFQAKLQSMVAMALEKAGSGG